MIHLARQNARLPSAIFGRVKVCYPSDGYILNIQEMELFFPRMGAKPDVVHLQADDFLREQDTPAESFCARVVFLASPDDADDFSGNESLFTRRGFNLEFNPGYLDLLEINEQNQAALPRLFIIGSRWFASVPVSVQPEIREKLTKLIHWKKSLFNYHPEHLPRETRTLNRELGMKVGYSETFLIEPEDPGQTVQILSQTFDRIFQQGMG